MKKVRIGHSRIHSKGLFGDEDIKKGERIHYIKGTKVRVGPEHNRNPQHMSTWYGLGRYTWINPGNTPFRFLNHSCEPNAAIAGKKTLFALENIAKGEEITIDYSMTDADPQWSLDCDCKTKSCRGRIGAIYTVPEEVYRRHMPYVPRYFQRAYTRTHARSRQRSSTSAQ